MDSKTKISTLKKDDLQKNLEKRGLNKKGCKFELVNRLKEAINSSYLEDENCINDLDDTSSSSETIVDHKDNTKKRRNKKSVIFRLINKINELEQRLKHLSIMCGKIKKQTLYTGNVNKNSPIVKDHMKVVSTANTHDIPLTYKTVNRISPESIHKILLLSDSHGRELNKQLRSKLVNNFQIQSFLKPNGCIRNITLDINDKLMDFNENDYVFLQAGTNDLEHCNDSTEINSVVNAFTELMESTTHTNVIVSTIPFRYDRMEYNGLIEHINRRIYTIAKRYSHVQLFAINNILCRRYYTHHGLHLNNMGKKVLCHYLRDYFVEFSCDAGSVSGNTEEPLVFPSRVATGDCDAATDESCNSFTLCTSLSSTCTENEKLEEGDSANESAAAVCRGSDTYRDNSCYFLECPNRWYNS